MTWDHDVFPERFARDDGRNVVCFDVRPARTRGAFALKDSKSPQGVDGGGDHSDDVLDAAD